MLLENTPFTETGLMYGNGVPRHRRTCPKTYCPPCPGDTDWYNSGFQGGESKDYQLWVVSGKEDSPYPLIGKSMDYLPSMLLMSFRK